MRAILPISIVEALLLGSFCQASAFLAPEQDILLPSSGVSINPLALLGANSPYFTGPNVYGISNEVPDNCYVEQVAYNVRHGSRYPDSGAYAQWTALYAEIQAANFTSTGSLAFLKSWKPVLTNPTLQIAQESPTGYKEAYDLGYQLRTRYPNLYSYGQPFISWANLYPRVVQTAQNFVRGFLGPSASSLGMVVTINSTGSDAALFDSLSPSDLCPAFVDGNGGTEYVKWNSIYLPPIQARLESLITGNLKFSTTDISIMPYLCGFESQITGKLSAWCGVFTDEELKKYEFAQDLRYYYGMGPGEDLSSRMMLPYLNALVGILEQGPGVNGTLTNGSMFTLPSILTAFMNDGQIAELGAVTGVWDNTTSLGDGTKIPREYKYISSHFVSMRGTVAFERMNCAISGNASSSSFAGSAQNSCRKKNLSSTSTNATYIRILLNDVVYPVHSCQSGPGSSCLLSDYSALIKGKVDKAGDLPSRCNVTVSGAPTKVKGASFFTDLSLSWLKTVVP
ncbi:cdbe87df-5a4d-46a6-865a-c115761b38db [Sclerotinia trifoliorum]|uniref:Cdbe87df-5a4d-46a6-865a-c115761b38db n=1 Tax=Sclerotinia trifoliorum TaxID=28548 RepID=A0A8H2VX92_9HELO|nr:cdbe87df-5a4d-46a6-865a-c115761b38db [Sclerotinia trifoliorum]